MSSFKFNWKEFIQEISLVLEFRLLSWSASKEEFWAASNAWETQVRVLSGFDRLVNGPMQEAVLLFSDAFSIDPSCMNAFLGRGIAYEAMNNFEQALNDYDQVLQLDPHCIVALCRRGWTHLALGQTSAALDDYTEAIYLAAPTLVFPTHSLAIAKTVMGDAEGALTVYDKTLRLARSDEERADILVNRGVLRYTQGLWEESADDFQKGIHFCEDVSCWSRFLLWHCYARQGKRSIGDAIIDTYLSSIERGPQAERTDWFVTLGQLLLGKVPEQKVLPMLDMDEPLRVPIRHCEAHYYLGSLALLNGNAQFAKSHFQKCLDTKLTITPEFVCAKADLARDPL